MQWLRTDRQLINVDRVTRFAVVDTKVTWELRAYFTGFAERGDRYEPWNDYDVISTHGEEADAVAMLAYVGLRVRSCPGFLDLRKGAS